ncbi:hypothetical protein ABIE44_002345 [Marmoricola sp. OAE513]|uniref:DUF3618 domain-containing protein n=1 Tax=Marmoricola sp. OAE513 TaxID=2817894 RepID=UPI001AEB566D
MSEVQQLEAEVRRRRAELEKTATSLSAKLDVPARSAEAVHRLHDRATTPAGLPKPPVVAAFLGAAFAAAALVWWRQRP